MKLKQSVLGLGTCFVLTSCATVFNAAYNGQVKFESQPEGALVVIDRGFPTCFTPCHIEVAMDRPHTFSMSLPGYTQIDGTLERKVAGTFWLNGILGVAGLVTSSLDWFTDSMWVLKKDSVAATLQPSGSKESYKSKVSGIALQTERVPAEFKTRIEQSLTPEKIREEIQKNFGVMSKEERASMTERLFYYMWQMEQQGVEADLETAITQEKARRQRN